MIINKDCMKNTKLTLFYPSGWFFVHLYFAGRHWVAFFNTLKSINNQQLTINNKILLIVDC